MSRVATACAVLVLSLCVHRAEETASLHNVKGADLTLLGDVREVAARVDALRGGGFARPPLAVRVPASVLDTVRETRVARVIAPERLAARGRAWADIGLGRESTPATLWRIAASDLRDIAFEPDSRRMLVTDAVLSQEDYRVQEGDEIDAATVLMMTGMRPDEPLVAHHLLHQRQLERDGGDHVASTTDALLASAAAAEGEANLVALQYVFAEMGLGDVVDEHRLDPGGFLDGSLLPTLPEGLAPAERALAEFIHRDGFELVVAAFRRGGWSSVGTLLARPRTTRALLHPDRAGAAPPSLSFESSVGADGMRQVDVDRLGEFAIFVLIAYTTGKDNLGLLAGERWVDDTLRRLERADGRSITEWTTRWEDEEAAADFRYAYTRSLEARFGRAVTARDPRVSFLVEGRRRFELTADGTTVVLRVTTAGG